MSYLYECKQVTFAYDKNKILEDISLCIEEGDFASIVGSNGSGKSTLIKLLIGSNKASEGILELYGESIDNFKDWNKVAYVSQIGFQDGVNFPATASEIIKLGLYSKKKLPKKETQAMIFEYAKYVGMQDNLNDAFSTMSGGQKQRILIAKALIARPSVLVLDEPTSSVDNESISILLHVLKHFNEIHNMSVVVATHDDRIIECSNKVFHIEHGLLVQEGC